MTIKTISDLGDTGLEIVNELKRIMESGEELIIDDMPTEPLEILLYGAEEAVETDRDYMRYKKTQGIKRAASEGKYRGKKHKYINMAKFYRDNALYHDRTITKAEFADDLGVTIPTLNKFLKIMGLWESRGVGRPPRPKEKSRPNRPI